MARTRRIFGALLVAAGWLVAGGALRAQTYSVIGSYGSSGGVFFPSRLVQGNDGRFYGTTFESFGAGSGGTIFKIDTDGTLTTLHVFSGSDGKEPYGGLVQAADGYLYGTTAFGGAGCGSPGCGTIFKIDTNGTTFTTLHSFTGDADGDYPTAGLIQAADGYLYGTTALGGGAGAEGTIFKMDTSGTTLTTLHTFTNSDQPHTGLIQGTDGKLYGTTQSGYPDNQFGSVFTMDTSGTTFTTLHSFALSDGARPSDLIQAADGYLYGTTDGGGASGYGTVFRVDTTGTMFATLHMFSGNDGTSPEGGVIQAADGELYGTTLDGGASDYGTIFKIATDGTGFVTLRNFANGSDGEWPFVGLIQAADGFLYGTTSEGDGGPSFAGTIFKIDTNGATLTTLHYFFYGGDGAYPYAGLVQAADGGLYGATYGYFEGYGPGAIFKIANNGTTPIALHHFSGSDGAFPSAGLIQTADGNLYGTTQSGGQPGGASGYGTIFKMATDGTVTTLYAFSGSDGAYPWAGLLQAADGDLYGTTSSGGAGYGTIFKIATDGTSFTTLHTFANSDGAVPLGGLIQGADGYLYGTTSSVGASGYGTIFKIDTYGTSLITLHSFVNSDGANPYASLIQATDGKLYGTTALGGASGKGTVFKIATDATSFATLHNFVGSDGIHPLAGLLQAADGSLYGTTFESGAGYGTIFKIDTNGTSLTTLHAFVNSDGANPYAGLIQAADGNLYGTATAGGPDGGGVVFKLVPCVLSQPPVVTAVQCAPPATEGLAASVSGNPADTYHWTVFGGTITDGQGTQNITFTSGAAGTRLSVQIFETDSNGCVGTAAEAVQVAFNDVPSTDPFEPYVCIIGRDGITSGCGGGNYCRDNPVTRAQMAIFLLKAEHGSSYTPPPCASIFTDVTCPSTFANWIEQLATEGVTAGCGGGLYCPNSPVTRRQMAVFLLKTKEGASYTPPPATGIFGDVPPGDTYAPWIEELYNRQITGGCQASPLLYCPDNPSTRGQMAVFLVKTFGLEP